MAILRCVQSEMQSISDWHLQDDIDLGDGKWKHVIDWLDNRIDKVVRGKSGNADRELLAVHLASTRSVYRMFHEENYLAVLQRAELLDAAVSETISFFRMPTRESVSGLALVVANAVLASTSTNRASRDRVIEAIRGAYRVEQVIPDLIPVIAKSNVNIQSVERDRMLVGIVIEMSYQIETLSGVSVGRRRRLGREILCDLYRGIFQLATHRFYDLLHDFIQIERTPHGEVEFPKITKATIRKAVPTIGGTFAAAWNSMKRRRSEKSK